MRCTASSKVTIARSRDRETSAAPSNARCCSSDSAFGAACASGSRRSPRTHRRPPQTHAARPRARRRRHRAQAARASPQGSTLPARAAHSRPRSQTTTRAPCAQAQRVAARRPGRRRSEAATISAARLTTRVERSSATRSQIGLPHSLPSTEESLPGCRSDLASIAVVAHESRTIRQPPRDGSP